jgi:crossover junction endodeoxyribonuclease RuvC
VIVLAVDVGMDGGLALFNRDGELVGFDKMPTQPAFTPDGEKKGRVLDVVRLAAWISQAHLMAALGGGESVMVREHVHAFPGQGGVSNFSFGYGTGTIDGMAAALALPRDLVQPTKWKKYFGLLKTEKKASIAKANALFPGREIKKDGVADAILIGKYYIELGRSNG